MLNSFFTLVGNAYLGLFTKQPTLLKGTQATAVASIDEHFVGIGKILAEGKVSEEHGSIVIAKMYDTKLAAVAAVQYGWNNGQGAQY